MASEAQGILNGKSTATKTCLIILTAIFFGLVLCGWIGEICYKKFKRPLRKTLKRAEESNVTTKTQYPVVFFCQCLACTLVLEVSFRR